MRYPKETQIAKMSGGGKRGRPPGKKDAKPRAAGRWSEQTREKHGAPPKAPPKNTRARDQPEIGAAFQGAAGFRGAGHAGAAAGSSSAQQSDSGAQTAAGSEPPPDDEPVDGADFDGLPEDGAEPEDGDDEQPADNSEPDGEPADAEQPRTAPRTAPRVDVEVVDIDDARGLHTADVRNGINMRYMSKLRGRLAAELSSKWPAFDRRALVEHLEENDFWVRAKT